MKFHSETLPYGIPDCIGEGHHFGTRSTAQIDQNQRLLRIDPGPTKATALPPALFYEPPGGKLDLIPA